MTSSRPEPPTHPGGAHRAWRRAPRSSTQPPRRWPPARDEPHLDGLFTYCLSVLCDHDAATEALGGALAVAERQGGRCPAGEEERKSWLYALARWMCLRKLAEREHGRRAQSHKAGSLPVRRSAGQGTKRVQAASGGTQPSGTVPQGARVVRRTPLASGAKAAPALPGAVPAGRTADASAVVVEAHRRELARLVWPEAAGTTPEQREALELAVRHRLAPRAVASVLGLEPATARELLATAACEVERTRAALAVVESGNCPAAARLAGGRRVLLSGTLRRELVRHVDDCPRCRRAAERAGAEGPWPGASVAPAAALAVVEAPRPSAYVAMVHARRNRSGGPRFDRTGFPMDPKDHAARRDRMRARLVTTTVLATVVAAPVIALWTAYRGAPQTGEGHAGASVTATGTDLRHERDGTADGRYENAGNARPGPRPEVGRGPDVSAEVISSAPGRGGTGRLAVEARTSDGTTLIRLTASGGAPVAWSARAHASWLRLSSSAGTLAEGESTTVRVVVDHRKEPAGPWSARIALAPWASVVAVRGRGETARPSRTPRPPVPPAPSGSPGPPVPSPSPSSSPDPEQSADPTPDPTDPAPFPADPAPSGSSTPTGRGTRTGAPPG